MIPDSAIFLSELISIYFLVLRDRYLILSEVEMPVNGSNWLKRTNEKPEGVLVMCKCPFTRSFDLAINNEI